MTIRPFALAPVLFLAGAALAQEPAQLKQVLEDKGRSIVVLKLVLKTEIQFMGQSQDQEQKVTIPGVVVNDKGLVMLTNSAVSANRIKEMFGGDEENKIEVQITPVSIKAVLEGEEKEYDAFLAASDARLDLAFVQLEGLGEQKVHPVQFAADATLDVGQQVLSISRLGEGFDYALQLEVGRISGRIKKPRIAWLTSGAGEGVGLPAFDVTGRAIGAYTLLSSGMRDEEGGGGMFGMGMGRGMGGPFQTVLIPASAVKTVIDQAATRAAEIAAERAKTGATGPGELPPSTPENGGGEGEKPPTGGEKKMGD